MNIKTWYQKRGLIFILERARRLNERYSLNSQKSIDRIEGCMNTLGNYACYPTFAVPGMVVEKHLSYILSLQDRGAEIAVHGYNHVDLKAFPPEEASRQLQYAAQVLEAKGLKVHGFRCPYLSITDDIIKVIPKDTFEYSSNKAIQWPICSPSISLENMLFETIQGFYKPEKPESMYSLPWCQDGLVEIPVCVPDDIQLHDGLGFDIEQVSQIWADILYKTHQRGELFNLIFHPELASFCEVPFQRVLQEARSLKPGVWLARLRDIGAWWKEKSSFRVETDCINGKITIKFFCSPKATILCRGFDPNTQVSDWDKGYLRLEAGVTQMESSVLPFIGLPSNTPQWVTSTLQGVGYIIDSSNTAPQCSLFLDESCLSRFPNMVELIDFIEQTDKPLVRFWPWPEGMRSALCISGDLDALSFLDYALRLVNR